MVQQKPAPVFSVNDLERDIEEEFRNRNELQASDFAPPRVGAPALAMPDYVVHREGATEIGKLSAEAVVREYETAAKEIETVGAELFERVKQCEEMTRAGLIVIQDMKETAARYREEAKRLFVQIEKCSQVTAEVRKTCSDLKAKIAVPTSLDKLQKAKK
jgi:hypothetical protein